MPRALSILKYVPAVLCRLLVVAWVAGVFVFYGFIYRLPQNTADASIGFSVNFGSIAVWYDAENSNPTQLFGTPWSAESVRGRSCAGEFKYVYRGGLAYLFIPLSILFTLLAPVAASLWIRFPLWSYFAWTALIAAELAYYLK